jgi:hypothetical protein
MAGCKDRVALKPSVSGDDVISPGIYGCPLGDGAGDTDSHVEGFFRLILRMDVAKQTARARNQPIAVYWFGGREKSEALH